MSNSMPNDYFSFMSDKGSQPALKGHAVPAVKKPMAKSDTIEFVEETSEMEVIEGTATDTMIQRVFTRWGGES
jgi:hypothetical protein